jgi:hypothetical protein
MADRNNVLRSYGQFVGRIWDDPSIIEELKANPVAVLNDSGFDIPADATVNLIFRELNLDGNPDTQVDLLAQGETTGVYTVIVPAKPENYDPSELPLHEEMLDLMAGGTMQGEAVAACCCSCPCCWDS